MFVIKLFKLYGEFTIPLIVNAPDNNKLYDITGFSDLVKYTFALFVVIFFIIQSIFLFYCFFYYFQSLESPLDKLKDKLLIIFFCLISKLL